MKKILIIEDEVAYLKLLSTQLTHRGYSIVEATNGEDGLKKARDEKPDLILLDIRMPIMDGMTMLDILRQEETGEKTKVIVLTNLEPNEEIVDTVVADEPSYYFVKSDIVFEDLLAKVEQLLSWSFYKILDTRVMENNSQITLAKLVSFLANERTILAYMRTSLALLATGVAFQEFFHKPYIQITGYILILLAVFVFTLGCMSFIKNHQKIKKQSETVPAHYVD